jgi:hypothetical protein
VSMSLDGESSLVSNSSTRRRSRYRGQLVVAGCSGAIAAEVSGRIQELSDQSSKRPLGNERLSAPVARLHHS